MPLETFANCGPAARIPSVRITDLSIGRERYPVSQVGETRIVRGNLQPSRNQFRVAFVGFSDEPEANLRYSYRLEGGESGWQGPGRIMRRTTPNWRRGPTGSWRAASSSADNPTLRRLLESIREAVHGGAPMSPEVARRMIVSFPRRASARARGM
jgi:hypothetical protein